MAMSAYMRRLRERVGHELLEAPSVTVAVWDSQDRLLLARHSAGDVWVMPGGSVEPEETPADAAIRETWEETGLLVDLQRIVGVYGGPEYTVRYPNDDATSYLMVVFEGRALQGAAAPDGIEVLELGYFRETEIGSLRTARWMPRFSPTCSGGLARSDSDAPPGVRLRLANLLSQKAERAGESK